MYELKENVGKFLKKNGVRLNRNSQIPPQVKKIKHIRQRLVRRVADTWSRFKWKLTFFGWFIWLGRLISRGDAFSWTWVATPRLFPELSPASNGFWIHSGPFSTFSLSIFHHAREFVSSIIYPLITNLAV